MPIDEHHPRRRQIDCYRRHGFGSHLQIKWDVHIWPVNRLPYPGTLVAVCLVRLHRHRPNSCVPCSTEYPRQLGHWSHEADDLYLVTAVSWPQNSGVDAIPSESRTDKRLCMKCPLVPFKDTWTEVGNDRPGHPSSSGKKSGYMRSYQPEPNTNKTNLFALLLLCQKFLGDFSCEIPQLRACIDACRRCAALLPKSWDDLGGLLL
jgi:hypothetical protein